MNNVLNGLLQWDVIIGIAFVVLVALPTALHARDIPERLRSIRRGLWGVLYVPFVFLVLVLTSIASLWVSRLYPILQWGWFGTNIIVAPVMGVIDRPERASQADASMAFHQLKRVFESDRLELVWNLTPRRGLHPLSFELFGVSVGPIDPVVFIAVLFGLLVFVLLVFNYVEEERYRNSWKSVGIWAVLHLVMGIPLYAVFPIFAVGVIFKLVHDRQGVETAYVTHFSMNCIVLCLLFVMAVFPPAVRVAMPV